MFTFLQREPRNHCHGSIPATCFLLTQSRNSLVLEWVSDVPYWVRITCSLQYGNSPFRPLGFHPQWPGIKFKRDKYFKKLSQKRTLKSQEKIILAMVPAKIIFLDCLFLNSSLCTRSPHFFTSVIFLPSESFGLNLFNVSKYSFTILLTVCSERQ